MRPSRFSTEQKVEAVIRNLQGESQEALSRELGVGVRTLKRWKKVFIEAGAARLGRVIESDPSPLEQFRRSLQRLSKEADGWIPPDLNLL